MVKSFIFVGATLVAVGTFHWHGNDVHDVRPSRLHSKQKGCYVIASPTHSEICNYIYFLNLTKIDKYNKEFSYSVDKNK